MFEETKIKPDSSLEIKETPEAAIEDKEQQAAAAEIGKSPDVAIQRKESPAGSELLLQSGGEKILWTGQPHPKKFAFIDALHVFGGLLLALPAVLLLCSVKTNPDDVTGMMTFFSIAINLGFAAPFLAIGLIMGLQPYWNYLRKKCTHFYVTNRRAIAKCNFRDKPVELSVDLHGSAKTTIFPHQDGYGTIIFEELTDQLKRQLSGYPIKEFRLLENTLVFFDVANVDDVQKIIDSIIAESVSAAEQQPNRMFARNKRKIIPTLFSSIYRIRLLVLIGVSLALLLGVAPFCYIIGSQSSQFGFVDKTGKTAVPARFDRVGNFSEGLAPVEIPFSHDWGFIDKAGNFAIKPQFTHAYSFSDGLASVAKNNAEGFTKWGFIDHSGKIVVPITFDRVNEFSDGLAPAMIRNNSNADAFDERWGAIDRSGKWQVEPKFYAVGKFVNGIAPAYLFVAKDSTDTQACLINKSGKIVVKLEFGIDTGDPYTPIGFSDGLLLATTNDGGKNGYIDPHGKFVIQPQFADGRNFSEGLAAVSVNGKWGYIDTKGDWVVQPQYENAKDFKEGVAPVFENGQWGYIDRHGKIVIKPAYKAADSFSESFACVTTKDGDQLISKSGRALVKAKQCADMHEGLSAVSQ